MVRRFLSVFFPSAEYQVTTRISTVEQGGKKYPFRTDGKVLVKPGWLAIYGKEAQDDEKEDDKDGKRLVPVKPGEMVRAETVEPKGLKTRPPARYSEATLLGAMEGAGKIIDDDELREAMQEKGLGTPATRAAIIEGLLNEKYMHPRRPRADPDRQGVPAHDAAARPRRGGALQGRAHRRMGVQARADGARQARAATPSCARSPR